MSIFLCALVILQYFTHTHINIYIYIYIYIHVCIYTQIYEYEYAHIHRQTSFLGAKSACPPSLGKHRYNKYTHIYIDIYIYTFFTYHIYIHKYDIYLPHFWVQSQHVPLHWGSIYSPLKPYHLQRGSNNTDLIQSPLQYLH
jgi:hypothetical protein